MKIGRILLNGSSSYAVFTDNSVYGISDFLRENKMPVYEFNTKEFEKNISEFAIIKDEYKFGVPLDNVNQVRDFYAFEEHVENSRKNRGLEMNPEWYKGPIYYYSNKDALIATGEKVHKPSFTEQLDLEVEIGIIVGKNGEDIKSKDALKYVFGLTLMNDWSARDLWRREAGLNLGPSKSKDFGTSIGPYITTTDELSHLWNGRSFDIEVSSRINGKTFSKSNMGDIYFSIGKMIEYCSMDSSIKIGDILMTGTMPGGCLFEKNDPGTEWLKRGDVIEISSDELGTLKNEVD